MVEEALPPSFRLPAVKFVEPFEQGDLDGLCGLYSVVNACRVVRASNDPLTERDLNTLLHRCLKLTIRSPGYVDGFMSGIPWARLKQLGRTAASFVSTRTSRMAFQCLPISAAERTLALKQQLLSGCAPVIWIDRDDHYSVVVGWTPTRAILFDSAGGHWLPIDLVEKALCFSIGPAACAATFELQ